MASNSETGHVVNIANFNLLTQKCTSYGATYNPSNADISLASMNTKWSTASTAHNSLTTALQVAKNPINAREILFDPLDKVVTKSFNYCKSTKASTAFKTDA